MPVKGDRAIWEAEANGLSLLNSTIGDYFDQQTQKYPDRIALVFNYPEIGLDLRLTYREFGEKINQVAKGLVALGVRRGDHVAIWGPNIPQWLYLQLALAKIGAVLVTVNPAYRTHELEYVLKQAEVKLLFMVEEVRGNSYLEAIYSITPELKNITNPLEDKLESAALPALKQVGLMSDKPQPGLFTFAQLISLGETVSDEALKERQAVVSPEDTGIIMYTSGTTGFPKGAMLTQKGILNASYLAAHRNGMTAEDIFVNPMPLFHIAGITSCSLPSFITGGTLVQLVGFDPTKQFELIMKEKGTISGGVPAMLIALFNHPRFVAGQYDVSSLRLVICGAAAVPVVLMEQVRDKFGANCGIILGQTEVTGLVSTTRPEDSFELKSSNVGLPLEHNEVKVVDLSTNQPVGFGEIGELLVRGPLIMQGYYKMPDKTAEAIDPEGWFRTGDLATMNAQGYLNIVGRAKEMVIRGGENIYPVEIEAFLMQHPKIADVQVLGVPDRVFGEELVALIKLKPEQSTDEAEIRDYCRASISHFKVPRYIKFVTEYPMTATGKVRKVEIREQLIKELQLEEVAKIKTA